MFADLDATLQAMLDDPAAPGDLRAADISFVTPDRDYKPAQPTVNAYLHEVAENRLLRDGSPVLERAGDGWTGTPPAIRVDCTYLITAWSPETAGLKVVTEHRLLGLALVWLCRFPEIPDRFLAGALGTASPPYPVPAVVAQTHEGQQMGHFWTALGTPPRPGFSITVTIPVYPVDEVEEFPAVREIGLASVLTDRPVLQGRVLDQALAVVHPATVSAVGTAVATTTDPAGRFALPGLDYGDYTLRVRAPGGPDRDVSVSYAERHQFHQVVLPGA